MGFQRPGTPGECSVIPNNFKPLPAAACAISCKVLNACPLAMVWVCTSNSIFIITVDLHHNILIGNENARLQ